MLHEEEHTLLVLGLPDAGRLRVQPRRDGGAPSLQDAYAAAEILYALPRSIEDPELLAALPTICMPDGVVFCDTTPPPPTFFCVTLPAATALEQTPLHVACIHYYEQITTALWPQLQHALSDAQAAAANKHERSARHADRRAARASSPAQTQERPASVTRSGKTSVPR